MNLIAPIDAEQQQRVRIATYDYIQLAGRLFNRCFPPIDVSFDLRGRSAGMYRVRRHERWIRYNPYLFAKYFDDNLQTTVPHEVAHYVTDVLHGLRNIRPHGPEWRAVMLAFGADDSVTCAYELTGIPQRRQMRYEYRCSCQSHQLSAQRHNKIRSGRAHYYCRCCGDSLVRVRAAGPALLI
ncbi:MAG: SprT-like domain-containing protein [Pseudomonadota bacterium]